uniref:Uncharacterized protein n=1 Tax=Oryza brachyantha TaxID=4533 RepID=J3NFD5_ORYBR
MILSPPHADHSPSMKLSTPESAAVLGGGPVGGGIFGEEAALPVADGDGAALGEDVGQ